MFCSQGNPCVVLAEGVVKQSHREQVEVQDHHAWRSSEHSSKTMLLDSMTVAFEPLAGCMVLLGNG